MPDVPDPGVSDGRLAVPDQADRLHRLNCQGLIGFDESTMRREIVQLYRTARIERPPERPEYLEPDLAAAIAWSHSYQIVASRLPQGENRGYIGKTSFSGQNR